MENNQLETTAREYRELQVNIKEMQEQADTLKQIMINEMDVRQAEKLQAGIFEIRYTLIETARLDTTALKSEMPTVAAQFTRTTTSTRFQVA